MIVILEGAERTGKTTLADVFEKHGFVRFKDYNHFKDMDPGIIQNRLDATLSFLIAADKAGVDVVMDRFHLSEKIYADLYRGRGVNPSLEYMDTILSKLDSVLIHTVREVDDDFVEAHPIFRNKEELNKLLAAFDYVIDKSEIMRKYKIDIGVLSDVGLDSFVEEVSGRGTENEVVNECSYDFYLASPFFNDEQIGRMKGVLDLLRGYGYKVYAPFEHGIVDKNESELAVKHIFSSNIEAINDSRMVLAITDGKDVGTIWEAGYAYAKGKKVVYFCESLGKAPFNIMLAASGVGIAKSMRTLEDMARMEDFTFKDGVSYE